MLPTKDKFVPCNEEGKQSTVFSNSSFSKPHSEACTSAEKGNITIQSEHAYRLPEEESVTGLSSITGDAGRRKAVDICLTAYRVNPKGIRKQGEERLKQEFNTIYTWLATFLVTWARGHVQHM